MPVNKTILVDPSALKPSYPAPTQTPAAPPAPDRGSFFLLESGKAKGPFSFDQLQAAVAAGKLGPKELILPSGSVEWVPAGEVKKLFPPARLQRWLWARAEWLKADKRRQLAVGASLCLFFLCAVWLGRPAKPEDPAADPGISQENRPPIAQAAVKHVEKPTGHQIYEQALKSTVWINNPGTGSGSGSLINAEEKMVLTNYHVVVQNNYSFAGKTLQSIDDTLARLDPRDKALNRPYKVHELPMVRSNVYILDLESRDFDAYLLILNAAGQVLAFDDDSGGNLNARIRFTPPYDGSFKVVATTFNGGVGKFTLKMSVLDPGASSLPGVKVAPYLLVNFPAYDHGQVISDKNHYLKLNNAEREKFKAQVVAFNEAKGLALLKLDHVPPGAEALPFAGKSARPGQLVHSIGNPGGSGALWVYTSGTVRTPPYQKQWQSLGVGGKMNHDALIIETQSPTNPGDSGGPLLNELGELVAVTQGNNLIVNSISLFIDVGEVRPFLRAHGCHWLEK